jgi:hypothetical protein
LFLHLVKQHDDFGVFSHSSRDMGPLLATRV